MVCVWICAWFCLWVCVCRLYVMCSVCGFVHVQCRYVVLCVDLCMVLCVGLCMYIRDVVLCVGLCMQICDMVDVP